MASHLFRAPSVADDIQQIVRDFDRTISVIEQLDLVPIDDDEPLATHRRLDLEERERVQKEQLHYLLGAAVVRLQMYADALHIPSLHRFLREWKTKWPEDSWTRVDRWSIPEADGVYSPPFTDLRHALDVLTVLSNPANSQPPELERRGYEQLEHALRSMAKVCRERGVTVGKESDLQSVVHSHLEATFPDYVRKVQISKPLVNFRPDGGVLSLKAAIECKVITSEDSLKVAIHGLTEDLSGYAGSDDWRRFYTLCYMTNAFAVEGQLTSALRASGNSDRWTVILVTAGTTKLSD